MGKWERDPHDWYVEPEWCSERLFEREQFEGRIVDPACGQGNIVKAARAFGHVSVSGWDIVDRGGVPPSRFTVFDFLRGDWAPGTHVSNFVCNPPFKWADQFAEIALMRATSKVALLLPSTWHLSDKRSRWLETTPLRRIWNLTPRPSMPPGTWLAAGNKAGNGTQDFAWYVWLRGYDGRAETRWLRRDP